MAIVLSMVEWKKGAAAPVERHCSRRCLNITYFFCCYSSHYSESDALFNSVEVFHWNPFFQWNSTFPLKSRGQRQRLLCLINTLSPQLKISISLIITLTERISIKHYHHRSLLRRASSGPSHLRPIALATGDCSGRTMVHNLIGRLLPFIATGRVVPAVSMAVLRSALSSNPQKRLLTILGNN